MNSKEFDVLINEKLNNYLLRSIDTTTGMAIKQGHPELKFDHLLVTLLQDGQGDIPYILDYFRIDPSLIETIARDNLSRQDIGYSGKPPFSKSLAKLIEHAWAISSMHYEFKKVRSGVVFEAFLLSLEAANSGFIEALRKIKLEILRTEYLQIVTDSTEHPAHSFEVVESETAREIPSGATILDTFTTNLTQLAKEGQIDRILGRDAEIIQMIEILSRRKKSNAIIVGEPGVGKTALVEGLALKIAADQVPEDLKDVQVYSLDLGAMMAGTKMRGEFEKRLKGVLAEVATEPHRRILFIDEAHTLIGAGGSAGSGDAANLLKPALARGEFKTIAATTYTEYNKYFAKDAALERRFQVIHVEEPDDERARLMLRGIKKAYETYHGIHISDEAVDAAVQLSRRYITGRQLPDKAVDLLDTAATRVKSSLRTEPVRLSICRSKLEALDLRIDSLKKDKSLGIENSADVIESLLRERNRLETDIADLTERWEQERQLTIKILETRKNMAALAENQKKNHEKELQALRDELSKLQKDEPQVYAEVNRQTVAEVIETWTGIPAGNMNRDEIITFLNLEKELKKRVVGQDYVINEIANTIRNAKVGIKKDESPIGVFLLVGPSGVGKTEVARAVAEALFGEERFMVTLNMTEYKNESNTSRLLGADPGLVGYGEGGALSEPVRRKPYSVVLLDEIEKAHSSVIDLFMQVFDRGMLTDAENRQIDFTNTVIFMTSNAGSHKLMSAFDKGTSDPKALLEILRRYWLHPDDGLYQFAGFRPEFLGRLKPLVFLPLQTETMKKIVEMKLIKLAERLQKNQMLDVTFDVSVLNEITAACTVVETGARNIDSIIDGKLAPEISSRLLTFMSDGKSPSNLTVSHNAGGLFSYDFQ